MDVPIYMEINRSGQYRKVGRISRNKTKKAEVHLELIVAMDVKDNRKDTSITKGKLRITWACWQMKGPDNRGTECLLCFGLHWQDHQPSGNPDLGAQGKAMLEDFPLTEEDWTRGHPQVHGLRQDASMRAERASRYHTKSLTIIFAAIRRGAWRTGRKWMSPQPAEMARRRTQGTTAIQPHLSPWKGKEYLIVESCWKAAL